MDIKKANSKSSSQIRRRNKINVVPPPKNTISTKKKNDRKPKVVGKKSRPKPVDDDRFDSIVEVDEGCRLIDSSTTKSELRKSVVDVVRSLSKQSLKKMILSTDDERIDDV